MPFFAIDQYSALPRRFRPLAVALLLAASSCSGTQATTDLGVADLEPLPPDLSPDLKASPDGPPLLGLGEYLDFAPDEAGKLVGSTRVTGVEEFLLLLLSLDDTPKKTHAYSGQEMSTQPMRLEGGSGQSWPGHSNFAEKVNAILRSKPASLRSPRLFRQAGTPPKVGDQRTFRISSGMAYVTINAEAVLVDDVAAYWLDTTTTPRASISDTTLDELATGFSQVVVPRLRTYFGKESDVDGDGTISVLFSPLVAEEALAYFSPCDLLDPKQVYYCGNSNMMEVLYLSPPSSLPGYMASPRALLETAAHELQHAIYFHRKYVVNDLLSEENPYVTEGLSGLAQDLSGYQITNIFMLAETLKAINEVSVPNMSHPGIKSYLPQPADSYLRGSGYLLLRYLFDRAGGDALDAGGAPHNVGGITFLQNAVSSKKLGLENLAGAAGLSPEDLMLAFWTALAVSNRGPNAAPICNDPKLNYRPTTTDPITKRQRGCNLFGGGHGFQLSGPRTQAFASADGVLRAGGAEFLLLAAKAGQPYLGFRVETPVDARARARLIRIK